MRDQHEIVWSLFFDHICVSLRTRCQFRSIFMFCCKIRVLIRHLYDGVSVLPRPEFLVKMLSYSNLSSLVRIETAGNISLTTEATNSILIVVVKWHHRANGLLWRKGLVRKNMMYCAPGGIQVTKIRSRKCPTPQQFCPGLQILSLI